MVSLSQPKHASRVKVWGDHQACKVTEHPGPNHFIAHHPISFQLPLPLAIISYDLFGHAPS